MKIVNLIGAGLIGQERLKAVAKLRARGFPVRVGWVHDPANPRLADLAKEYQFAVEPEIGEFLSRNADLVVIACPHDVAVEHTCRALNRGHTVLIEKPMGRNLAETEQIAAAAANGGGLFIGLNYRFMPGIAALLADWRSQRFGSPISLRMQMGHGGKPGDEKTWKLDPVRCGGGALLDPGIHLLDLITVMTRNTAAFRSLNSWQGFWRTGIEEDTQLMFRAGEVGISMEVSVVRWRSHFEIFALGSEGYGYVTGRGRSYGRQSYRRGRRWGWQSAKDQVSSEELVLEDACEDSFAEELAACLGLGPAPLVPPANLKDGTAVMQLYQAAKAALPN
jgi:predicted dehydrogenase